MASLPGADKEAMRLSGALHEMGKANSRKARREELAAMLLLKLVENTNGRGKYDMDVNVRAAVEYTDALLAELEKQK